MIPHAMLVLVLLVHLAPEHLAEMLGHSQAAWAYVAYGVESAVLWVLVALVFRSPSILAIGAFGAMESAQRAACRLALPMDKPPALGPGQTVCDAATGLPISVASLLAAFVVIVVADVEKRPVLAWR